MRPLFAGSLIHFAMRSAAFVFLLLAVTAAAVWVGMRLIITTDPDAVTNVLLFLFVLFLASGTFGALCAWALWARRWPEPRGYRIALRQGGWVGLVVALAALLQVWQILTWLALGAMFLVFGGFEALLLLQPDPKVQPTAAETSGATGT